MVHIVDAHRGRLDVDSVEGLGSTFTIHVPAVAPAANNPSPATSTPLHAEVLIVEDEPALVLSLEEDVKGTEGWASTVSVMGLPDRIYTFVVRLNTGAPQAICSFEIAGEGSGSCSDNDAALMGFNQALIVDGNDVVVAGGVFVRRGGNREQ